MADENIPLPPMPTAGSQHTEGDEQPAVLANTVNPENELVVLDPSHPLMSRFQSALKKQLTKQKEKLDQEIRETSDVQRRFKQEREDVGVLLYGVQQELAKQQTEFELCQDNHESLKELRQKAETDLAAQRQVYEHANEEFYQHNKKNLELQSQVEQLNQKILYMDEAKKEVESDVKTLHRATSKAGVELVSAELDKRRQDIFVDRLTGRVEEQQDEKRKYVVQLKVQEKETGAYREMLSEARTEIDSIELDKKRLMQQWDSAVISMRKRDELFTEKQEEMLKIVQDKQSTEMEVISLKKNILSVQHQNEQLHSHFSRIENDMESNKRKLAECQKEKDQTLHKYSELMAVFNATEQDLKISENQKTEVENTLSSTNREIEKEHNLNRNLEAQVDTYIQDKRTASQAASALQKEIDQVRGRRRELEAELARTENIIVRDALESSSVVGRNRVLDSTCKQLTAEIRQINEKITAVEQDINRKHSKIERNQTAIDAKNKMLDQALANAGGEDLGPLEIQASSLKKSLEEITQEIVEQEQFWLRKQYELVKVSKDKAKKNYDLDSLKKQFTIYLQRKLRIEREIEAKERERRETLRSIRSMQNDMLKLNTLLNKESLMENDLEQGNILAENEFIQELKEAELSMIELEKRRDSLYHENQKLTRALLEAERQVMLWEGKTQLAKETRDAVDKEVGQGEIKQMKSEIHRMEVRFSQLMKEQEKLMRESEHCIEQRVSITTRAEARAKNGRQKTNLTKTAFERQMQEKKKTIKKMQDTTKDIETHLSQLEIEQQTSAKELQDHSMMTQQIYNKTERVQNDLLRQQDEKNLNTIKISTKQNLLKNIQAMSDNKLRLTARSIEQTKDMIKSEQQRAQNLQNICERLSQDYPPMAPSLRTVSRTLAGTLESYVAEDNTADPQPS